jgi:hypothetical protein
MAFADRADSVRLGQGRALKSAEPGSPTYGLATGSTFSDAYRRPH